MKILYVGNERSDAQAAATALRGLDREVTVSWASHLDQAVRWVDEHRDASALVVESQVDEGRWASVLSGVRAGVSGAALLVILPDGAGAAFDALDPTADDYLARNTSLLRDLPIAVMRAIVRARDRQRADVEQRLAHATTALQDAEHRHRAALAAAEAKLSDTHAQFEIGMARATANWDMVDEQLRDAALQVERARHSQAEAVADVERLTRQQSEIASRLAQAEKTNAALEQRIVDGNAAVERANARIDDERRAADERLTEHQRDFESRLAEELDQRRSVEDSLAHASADLTDRQTTVESLIARESELNAQLTDLAATRGDLERRLTATQAAFEDATTRATRDRLAASKRAAEREAELDGQIQRERSARTTLERAVADAEAALTLATQQHQDALDDAAADLADRQHRFDRELTEAASDRARLADQLSETAAALDRARQDHESAVSDVERLTQREADLTAQLVDVQAIRQGLDAQLADAHTALQRSSAHQAALEKELQHGRAAHTALEQTIADGDAARRHERQQHEAALAAAAADLAERQSRFDRELTHAASERARLADHVSETAAALDRARQDHESAAADVERLKQREADLTAQLVDVQAIRHGLDAQLAEAHTALQRSSAHQAALEEELQHGRAAHSALEQTIADGKAARHHERQQHEGALAAAAADLAERQGRFDRELTDAASERARLADQLSETAAALDRARQDHESAAADAERLTQREAELTARLADLEAARQVLDAHLGDTTTALQRVSAHESELEEEIQRGRATHAALEQTIATGEAARRDERQQHEAALAATAADLAERQAQFDRAISDATSDRERIAAQLNETEGALDRSRHDHETDVATIERLEHRVAEFISQLAEVQAARHSLEIQLSDATTAIADELSARSAIEQTLAETRSAALDAERAFHDDVDAARATTIEQRARFEVQIAQERLEHETRLADAQEQQRTTALQRDGLQQSLHATQQQSAQLQTKLTAVLQDLEIAKRHHELLQAEIDQLPRLRKEIEDHRAESHRLFDQAGLAMFRCTANGALAQINRACATLVGRRTVDDLPAAQFSAAVFEAPNVLSWLIERCVSTHSKESVETTWRRQDGGRLFVRLSARWIPSDVIEIAVDDLTRVRVLQERLGQAHRMEAVGRFASEVAATCGHLLDDIHEKGRDWLSHANVEPDSRHQCELLVEEVGRAAGFVRQLAEVGDEQVRTPMLVDLNTAVRDLEPVLKRVAGGDVEVQVRDTSSPLMVDVATERVERLLVNLASYGRQCMPTGGRLKIELGTIVVDRHFVAKHPNVRMGVHALITMTQTKRAGRSDATRTQGRATPKPGVDFTIVQGLVNDCGGHLWIRVQPQGGMEAKVRVPLVSSHDQPQTRAVAVRSGRERLTARLFQS